MEPDSGSHSHVIGFAYLNENIVYIPTNLIENGRLKKFFREVVAHEIIHAVTGFGHDEKCPLMSSAIASKPLSDKDLWKHFTKYFK